MSESTNTLAGLLLLNDKNMSEIFPSDVLDQARVIRRLYAQPASQGGTLHKFLNRQTEAGAAFRAIGDGVANAAATFKEIDVVCKYLDASCVRDVASAQGYRGGISAYMQRETFLSLRAAFFTLEKSLVQTISDGPAGLNQDANYNQLSDSQVVNAGGSGGTSVWMLRTAQDGVSTIAGNDGNMTMLWDDSAPTIVAVDGSVTGSYSAYKATIGGYFGWQVGSKYDVVRICNLDNTTGHKLTDALLGAAMALFPAALPPNLIIMPRRERENLRASRTATTPTGKEADIPDNFQGVPIEVTDAIPLNESAIS